MGRRGSARKAFEDYFALEKKKQLTAQAAMLTDEGVEIIEYVDIILKPRIRDRPYYYAWLAWAAGFMAGKRYAENEKRRKTPHDNEEKEAG